MFGSVLIANRGEIACRVIRTAHRLGLRAIAVHSDADATAAHVAAADQAVRIGPAPARQSYLDGEAILDAARRTSAEAIHPGYGFLSENADFAEACARAGIIFIGPPPEAIRAMGLKDRAKALMRDAGVPIVPGAFGPEQDRARLSALAMEIGYPIMIKAVAGGGGKGMRRVDGPSDFDAALDGARREAVNAFGDDRVMLERYVTAPRHIEVQIFADDHGGVVHLFERDCSLQRRHQKVIEEAPAPGMTEAFRARITEAATRAARAIGYRGAGTVEFIADGARGLDPDAVYFLEMNTRLQVEHPVTEMITGLDLVEWQFRVAAGEPLPLRQDEIHARGHAMEARLYAEDPARDFLPSIGRLNRLVLPAPGPDLRVDSGVRQGDVVSVHYDPMIAKVIAWGPTRDEAARRLARALDKTEVIGVETNAAFLARLATHPAFLDGAVETGFIAQHDADLRPDEGGAIDPERAALGALVLILDRAARLRDPSPFAVMDNFRPNLAPRERVSLIHRETPLMIDLVPAGEGFLARIDGREIAISGRLDGRGGIDAEIDGIGSRAAYHREGGRLSLLVDGRALRFDLPDPLAGLDEDGASAWAIHAPMPGKVIELAAKIGESVRKGQALAVLEAMKMEHTLVAPRDGAVARIAVAPGDQVAEGDLIIALSDGEAP